MQKFFFDLKDGVPFSDRIGIDLKGNLEAIVHCKEVAQHLRDGSLRDDLDLEISVVNAAGQEIHREFVRYREFLVELLERRGITVEVPMAHRRRGEQLSWLSDHQ